MRKITILVGVAAAAMTLGACELETEPTPVQPAEAGDGGSKSKSKKPVPIKLVAKRTRAEKSILSDGGALSCVRVTVTNQTRKNVEVNPLYFSMTDSKKVKHDASTALGMYEGQIDTTTLAPKEKAKGIVCAEGRFVPKVVAMTNPLFSEAARAEVSGS